MRCTLTDPQEDVRTLGRRAGARHLLQPAGLSRPRGTPDVFREIMLRVYERQLAGLVPSFPLEIEEGIDRYLAR
jgi:hypothetical protein